MKTLLLFLTVLFTSTTFAQSGESEYQTAIGAKVSSGVALSYKKFITSSNALEAQLMVFNKGTRLIGLYEFHFYNIEGLGGIGWYVGGGAHAGIWKKEFKSTYNSSADVGVDGVIGVDYRFRNTPINISLDWQPSFSVLGKPAYMPQFAGIALRYVIY